jgi:tetratricopeptide (TPR) repeat protein
MGTSRLLTRLDAAIAAAGTTTRADCLRAERAGYLARLGQLDEARQVLSSLHMQYASHPNAAVSAWLAYADGLLGYFSDMGEIARDKMRRAYALSGAARDVTLQALSAAWLALLDFMHHDFDAMGRHLAEAVQFAAPDHHAAQARAAMLAGQVYHFAGRFDLAQPWYAKARQHATADGDEATQAAVIHNMAWMHANQSRQALLCGSPDGVSTRQAALGAESSSNFDSMLGVSSLDALVPILRAQVLTFEGQWAAALDLFETHISDAMTQGLARMQPNLRAEMAWCRLQLGQTEAARADARAAVQALEDECDVDDRAAAHSRLSKVFESFGDEDAAQRHAELAARDWAVHVADQARAVTTMDQALGASRSG